MLTSNNNEAKYQDQDSKFGKQQWHVFSPRCKSDNPQFISLMQGVKILRLQRLTWQVHENIFFDGVLFV